MPSAVIYVRISDAKQVGNTSLAEQERICRQQGRAQHFDIVGGPVHGTHFTRIPQQNRQVSAAPEAPIHSAAAHPAEVGLQVFRGFRQSIPSSI